VGHHQERTVVPLGLFHEQVDNILFVFLVQVSGWFVSQQYRWVVQHSATNSDALLFAL
jgi:hypothetical protein